MFGFDGAFAAILVIFAIVSLCIIGVIITVIAKGTAQWNRNNKSSVESVPARVVAKPTQVSGGVGDSSASTYYFATFELADHARLELPVRATDYGQLVEGDQGALTHQGTRFKGFRRQQFSV